MRRTKRTEFESGDEGTRLLHARNGDEDRAGAAKRTRRKRGRWREGRCRWWKSRGIKPKAGKREREIKTKKKENSDPWRKGGWFSLSFFFFEDGERDTEGE